MNALTLSARDLADGLHNIAPHAETDVSPLNHLLLDVEGRHLAIVGSDRYTLARQDVPLLDGDETASRLLWSQRVKPLVRALDKHAKSKGRPTVVLDLAAGILVIDGDEHPLDGAQNCAFPNYQALWPTSSTSTSAGHATFGLGAKHVAKYTDLRLRGAKHPTYGNLRMEAGPRASSPILVTPVELEAAGVLFRSLLMPVKLAGVDA